MDNENRHPEQPLDRRESPGGAAEEIRHPDVRFEPKDVNFGILLGILIAGGFVLILISFSLWRYLGALSGVEPCLAQDPHHLNALPADPLPPSPRLEPINRMAGREAGNVDVLLSDKERRLNSYGPTGEEGFVQIPIQEAIRLTAAKLPVRTPPPSKRPSKNNLGVFGGGPPSPPAPLPKGEGRYFRTSAKDRGLVDWGESNSGRMFRPAGEGRGK